MTRPIFEPNLGREVASAQFATQQLFRRPAPNTGTGLTSSWGRGNAEVTTSTIDFVEPDFASGTNHTFERTPNDGRWSINGSGRLELASGQDGLFMFTLNIFDVVGASNHDTYAKILVDYPSSPTDMFVVPGWFDSSTDTSAIEYTFPILQDSTNTDFESWTGPRMQFFYIFNSNAALNFRLRCAVIEDSNFIATTMNVICALVQVGPATQDVTT